MSNSTINISGLEMVIDDSECTDIPEGFYKREHFKSAPLTLEQVERLFVDYPIYFRLDDVTTPGMKIYQAYWCGRTFTSGNTTALAKDIIEAIGDTDADLTILPLNEIDVDYDYIEAHDNW